MKSPLLPSLLCLTILASPLKSEDNEEESLFSFSFFPEAQEFLGLRDSQDGDGWQSIGGFNLGMRSPETSGDLAWHTHVNVTEYQSLWAAGISSVLWENESVIISGKALGGYAFGHKEFIDSWHGSFDLYGATALGRTETNLMKLGVFVDLEEDFGKWGPEAAFLFGADKDHPVTLDLAYGRGIGDPIRVDDSVWSVARDDLQMRAGVFVNRRLQVGLTGQYQKWNDAAGVDEDWKTGGFVNWYSNKGMTVSLGMAGGEHGSNGFASVSIRPGSESRSPVGSKAPLEADFGLSPRTWMLAPVQRLRTVAVRRTALGGTLEGLFLFTGGDPATQIGPVGSFYQATYTNTSALPQTVRFVSLERFDQFTIDPSSVSGTIPPGGTLSASAGPSAALGPDPYIQTVRIIVNGQTFDVNLSFPSGIAGGTPVPAVPVP